MDRHSGGSDIREVQEEVLLRVLGNRHRAAQGQARVRRHRDRLGSVSRVADRDDKRGANDSARNSGKEIGGSREDIATASAVRIAEDEPGLELRRGVGHNASRGHRGRVRLKERDTGGVQYNTSTLGAEGQRNIRGSIAAVALETVLAPYGTAKGSVSY